MDSAFAKKLLDVLIDNALRILGAGFGVNWAESTFFDIVRLLQRESNLRGYFLERASATFSQIVPGRLDPGMVPVELIELVAHELRWPEFQVLARKRIEDFFGGDENLATGDVAQRVTQAFEHDWQDQEFYEHYKR